MPKGIKRSKEGGEKGGAKGGAKDIDLSEVAETEDLRKAALIKSAMEAEAKAKAKAEKKRYRLARKRT